LRRMQENGRGDVDGVSITIGQRACQVRPSGNAITRALGGIASNQSGELVARLNQDCWNDALRRNVADAGDQPSEHDLMISAAHREIAGTFSFTGAPP
jgi:hypothetical protein